MKKLLALFFLPFLVHAQHDTLTTLKEITVRGYETGQNAQETPASLIPLGEKEVQRYILSDPLPLFNAHPGVRLEERSPGSYRLALRGSALRSPYGVRNVKVYWEGIPLSDANGTTYFNLIDFSSVGRIEIIKGPSGSIYGAGNGGVIHINTPSAKPGHTAKTGLQIGSYNTLNYTAQYQYADKKLKILGAYSNRKSDGYRNHSKSKGENFLLNAAVTLSPKHHLNYLISFAKTDYQTPGGLNLAQMQADRKASRPATATLPSSATQNASIAQEYILNGLNYLWMIQPKLEWNTTLFHAENTLTNPFITSYEDRKEKTHGYRSVLKYRMGAAALLLGSEGLFTRSVFDVKENNAGTPGAPLYLTRLNSRQLTHFIQLHYRLWPSTLLTAGISYNTQFYRNRTEDLLLTERPGTPWTPRIAVQQNLSPNKSLYYAFSNGYSPPTAQEMTANYENGKNLRLEAEKGLNHELGFKAQWTANWSTEITVFQQNLQNALTRHVEENGNEWFQNTGKISQKGLELSQKYRSAIDKKLSVQVLLSASLSDYKFKGFVNENQDFSGKKLPGLPGTQLGLATRLNHLSGLYLNVDLGWQSAQFLNSQNTVKAEDFYTSRLRLGIERNLGERVSIQAYAGADNVLNQYYSLGFDFNAIGNRFYNPAPLRNYNGGLLLAYKF
jgi:iron complex outermembrane receptor protein